jgi:hypothetical protein
VRLVKINSSKNSNRPRATVTIELLDETRAGGPEIGRVSVSDSKNSMSDAFLRVPSSSRAQPVAIERKSIHKLQ